MGNTPPNLSFYYGQEIADIVAEGDGWAIVLESGVRIVNLDPEYDMPDNTLVGMSISKATFGPGVTVLYAGPPDNPTAAQIGFNPTVYGIDDPSYTGPGSEGLYRPQLDDNPGIERRPVDPARMAEGPTQPDAEAPENVAELVADEDEVDPQ